MPVVVNIRHLETQNVRLKDELPASELDIDTWDEMVRVERPLCYDLEVQLLERSLLVHGRLHLVLDCQCVRCLKPFQDDLELKDWTVHLPLHGEERVAVVNDCVDLTPYVREDILLEFPQHPLCEPECRGLPKPEIGQAKKGSGAGQIGPASAWADLDKLNLKRF
jgi:uncharacterized protein